MTGVAAGTEFAFYLPDNGWMLFRWDGLNFVSDVDVYRYANGSVHNTLKTDGDRVTKAKPLVVDRSKADFYRRHSVSGGQPIVRNGWQNFSGQESLEPDSPEMSALVENLSALSLYECMKAVGPSIVSTTKLLAALSSSGVVVQKNIIKKHQSCMQLSEDMQRFFDTVGKMSIIQMLESPAFQTLSALAPIIMSLIVSLIVAAFGTFGFGFILLAAAIAGAVASIAVAVVTTVKASKDRSKLDELEDNLGENKDLFKDAIGAIRRFITTAQIVLPIIEFMAVASSAIGGAAAANQAVISAEVIARIIYAISMSSGVMARSENGLLQFFSGTVHRSTAPLEENAAIANASLSKWEAVASYFSSMQERLSAAVKDAWNYMEQLYKAQTEIIKTLGEGLTALTRNVSL
ncbi:MAG: hypothetical protein LBI39_01170 [Puniceicoccales bacterium]|nr:hypothetical protein [Puniceicoccales bacterium]